MSWKDKLPKENRYFETEKGILYLADSFKLADFFPKNFFDLIYTDPPYNYNIKNFDFNVKNMGVSNEERIKKLNKIINFDIKNFFEKFETKLKKQHYYIWSNKKMMLQILKIAENKKLLWELLIYAKKNPVPLINGSYLKDKEYCIFLKESNVYFNTDIKDNMFYKTVMFDKVNNNHNTGHPTVKHLWMVEKSLKISCKEDCIVLDPFVGSGTTIVAAEKLGLRWVAVELEKEYADITVSRLKKVVGQKKLNGFFDF